MWKEFRLFISRGNVIDLAVGIVIGTAFNRIVTSFVNDILMPPIGLILGRVNFSDFYVSIKGPHLPTLSQAQQSGDVTINYGVFINNIIDFLIVAFAVFILIQQVNRIRNRFVPPPPPPATKECPFCYSTISVKATRCPDCTSYLG